MRKTGYSRQTGLRELNVQCNGYGPSFHMERTHFHDCFELYLQIDGDRHLLCNGKFVHVEPGDVVWIKSFDPHQSFAGRDSAGIRAVLYFS